MGGPGVTPNLGLIKPGAHQGGQAGNLSGNLDILDAFADPASPRYIRLTEPAPQKFVSPTGLNPGDVGYDAGSAGRYDRPFRTIDAALVVLPLVSGVKTGMVKLSPGTFPFSTKLDLSHLGPLGYPGNSVIIEGSGGVPGVSVATILQYTGADIGPGVRIDHQNHMALRNLRITAASATFSGDLVDAHGASTPYVQSLELDRVRLDVPNSTARSLLWLQGGFGDRVHGGYFSGAKVGVLGLIDPQGTNFINGVVIDDWTWFTGYGEGAIKNAGEGWTVGPVTLEPGAGAAAGKCVLYVQDQRVHTITNVTHVGSIATFTTADPHGYLAGDVVTTSGNLPASYNKTSVPVISAPTPTTFTIDLGVVPPSDGTGFGEVELGFTIGRTLTFVGIDEDDLTLGSNIISWSGKGLKVFGGNYAYAPNPEITRLVKILRNNCQGITILGPDVGAGSVSDGPGGIIDFGTTTGHTGFVLLGESTTSTAPGSAVRGTVPPNSLWQDYDGTLHAPQVALGAAVNLVDAANVAVDESKGSVFSLNTGSSRNFSAPTNRAAGRILRILIVNTSGGSITPTWDASYNLAGGVAPTIAAGKVRIIEFLDLAGTGALYEITRAGADL